MFGFVCFDFERICVFKRTVQFSGGLEDDSHEDFLSLNSGFCGLVSGCQDGN